MEYNNFQDKIEAFQTQLPPQRKLIINDNSKIPFALGFTYNERNNKWYIYENDERSNQSIRYERDTKEEIKDIFY